MNSVNDPAAAYADLAGQVRELYRAGESIAAVGGATLVPEHPAWGRPVSTRELNEVVAFAREDLTITVQAGMTIAALEQVLGEHNLHLPLDVPAPERTTIGGLIATNPSGSRRFGYGTVRDLLLGIRVIGADGELIRGGGRVVKNVAGYDLCKLYTGSWGWFGVIVEATFRVSPRPEASGAVALPCDTAQEVEGRCAEILSGPLRPSSLDLVTRAAVSRQAALLSRPFWLIAGFDGSSATVRTQVIELLRADASAVNVDGDALAWLRQHWADLRTEAPVFIQFAVRSSQVAELVVRLNGRFADAAIVAQIANGAVGLAFTSERVGESLAAIRVCEECGGNWLIPAAGRGARSDGSPVGQASLPAAASPVGQASLPATAPGEAGRDARSTQQTEMAAATALPMLGPPREDWSLIRQAKIALDEKTLFNRGHPLDLALRGA